MKAFWLGTLIGILNVVTPAVAGGLGAPFASESRTAAPSGAQDDRSGSHAVALCRRTLEREAANYPLPPDTPVADAGACSASPAPLSDDLNQAESRTPDDSRGSSPNADSSATRTQ